jgi:hypothetical protein
MKGGKESPNSMDGGILSIEEKLCLRKRTLVSLLFWLLLVP